MSDIVSILQDTLKIDITRGYMTLKAWNNQECNFYKERDGRNK